MSEASERTEIEYGLLVNADAAYGDIRKVEIICMRLLSIVSKMAGGNPSLQNYINMIQKTVMWVRHLQMVLHAFEVAVKTGPLGWVYAIVMAFSFMMTTADTVSDGLRTAS